MLGVLEMKEDSLDKSPTNKDNTDINIMVTNCVKKKLLKVITWKNSKIDDLNAQKEKKYGITLLRLILLLSARINTSIKLLQVIGIDPRFQHRTFIKVAKCLCGQINANLEHIFLYCHKF